MRQAADLIDLVDHLYRIDESVPEQEWLAGIASSASRFVDYGLGTTIFTYDLDASRRLSVHSVAASRDHEASVRVVNEFSASLSQPCVTAPYGCAASSELAGFSGSPGGKALNAYGIKDVFFVNGMNPGGTSVFISVPSPDHLSVSHHVRRRWERVAAHVGASYRLRNRLAGESRADAALPLNAEAVILPTGRIEHAEVPAQGRFAREALREGAKRMARAHGVRRRDDPDQAIEEWRGLVAARWTLVEVREIGGRRFFLACENQTNTPRLSRLTAREQQVAAFASFGYAHKLIAYHLGISASTSRVLLRRALTKLGIPSRRELAAMFLESTGF